VLELGCGTGRIGVPLTGTGSTYVGIDRSEPMLVRGRRRLKRVGRFVPGALVRGDIRTLPFADRTFRVAVAPYGILQSLLSDRALASALREVARTLEPGGVFGLDLVPDVPQWNEYRRRVSLTGTLGRQGAPVTLVESVRQDRKRRLTIFDQEYVVGRGRARERHCFSLTFRTIGLDGLRGRLERAGFSVTAVLGDYRGGPWDERADAWIVLATRLAS
jgi:SAM-dependent methyltransferase